MIFIGILGRLKSSFGGGEKNSLDSKIDSAFSRPSAFGKPPQMGLAGSSVSERVLAGQDKFSSQFSQRPVSQAPVPSGTQFGRNDDFGRFEDLDNEFKANPLDFNDDLNPMNAPKPPPPLQIRRDMAGQQGMGQTPTTTTATSFQQPAQSQYYSAPQASSLQEINKPVGFPGPNSNIPERISDSASSQGLETTYTEKRLFDELEDIKAQNNEILRRIQRLEAKIR